jgi:hypothetical protein
MNVESVSKSQPRLNHRPVRRWPGMGGALVLAVSLFLVSQWAVSQWTYRAWFWRDPLHALRTAWTLPQTLSAPADAAWETRFEAEDAVLIDAPGADTWQGVSSDFYSLGRAVYTAAPGSRLTWPVAISPGEYDVQLGVYAYDAGRENNVIVKLDGNVCRFHWSPVHSERRLELSQRIRLSDTVRQLTVEVEQIGQMYVVLDNLILRDRRMHGNILRDKFSQLGIDLLVNGLLAWTALCAGALVVRWVPLSRLDPTSRLVVAFFSGSAMIGTIVTLLGLAQSFNKTTAGLSLAIPIVFGIRETLRRQTALFRHVGFTLACFGLAIPVLVAALAALAPAAGVDTLIYHLPIAKWLVRDGGFTYHPYQLKWGFPHLASNLYAVCQVFTNDPYFRDAQLHHAVLGAAWFVAVYCLGKVMFGRATGLAVVFCVWPSRACCLRWASRWPTLPSRASQAARCCCFSMLSPRRNFSPIVERSSPWHCLPVPPQSAKFTGRGWPSRWPSVCLRPRRCIGTFVPRYRRRCCSPSLRSPSHHPCT